MAASGAADPEVEMATKAALEHRSAYASRVSTTTRNPHAAKKGRSLKELMAMKPADRVITQWRTAFGDPVSDEAKAQFGVECLGHRFDLADVRLWLENHPQRAGKETRTDVVHLEFFFDGMLSEIQEDPPAFERAFAQMVEHQLQERRCVEFRKQLQARQRRKNAGGDAADADAEGAGGGGAESSKQDSEWKSFLKKPVEPTQLSVRSMREAGCMLRFLVCQTSLSVSASEELGQIAFQEHFPIDGVEQDPSKSTKPLPTWVYWMGLATLICALITIWSYMQIAKAAMRGNAALMPP